MVYLPCYVWTCLYGKTYVNVAVPGKTPVTHGGMNYLQAKYSYTPVSPPLNAQPLPPATCEHHSLLCVEGSERQFLTDGRYMWNFREHNIQMLAYSSHSDLFLSPQ